VQKYVAIIDQCSNTSLSILNDILDTCKFESGEFAMEDRLFELKSVFDGVVNLFQERAHSKKVSLESLWPRRSSLPGMIKADSVRIGQILSNLISK
jgi:signal transduction histidine kinase